MPKGKKYPNDESVPAAFRGKEWLDDSGMVETRPGQFATLKPGTMMRAHKDNGLYRVSRVKKEDGTFEFKKAPISGEEGTRIRGHLDRIKAAAAIKSSDDQPEEERTKLTFGDVQKITRARENKRQTDLAAASKAKGQEAIG